MKKYKIISLLVILLMGACTDQLRENQLKQAEDVSRLTSARYLLTGSIVRIANYYQDRGFGDDKFNAIMEYYQQLFSVKSQLYEEFAKAPEDWSYEYRLLYETKSGMQVAEEEGAEATKAAFMILQSFLFEYMTDIFGDIPYSEAISGREGIVNPKFDNQQEIYEGLLKTLDEAVNILSSTSDNIDADQDLLYFGNKEGWIRFANSLKLRMLVRSYDAFGGSKQSDLQTVAKSLLIDDNQFNAALDYEGTNSGNSWPYGNWRDNTGADFTRRKASVTFIGLLQINNDPRLQAWIAPALKPWASKAETVTITDIHGFDYLVQRRDTTGAPKEYWENYPIDSTYVGAPVGRQELPTLYGDIGDDGGGAYENFKLSSFSMLFQQNAHPLLTATLMEASEVSFCLAEAAAKNWISGDASSYYERGIRQNMERWGVAIADISAYIANNPLSMDTNNALRQIGTEKWKSFFTQGHQAWFNYRRTGFPVEIGNVPPSVTQPFPLRWRYPTVEEDNNTENYQEAVARLGEDTQTAKMWLIK